MYVIPRSLESKGVNKKKDKNVGQYFQGFCMPFVRPSNGQPMWQWCSTHAVVAAAEAQTLSLEFDSHWLPLQLFAHVVVSSRAPEINKVLVRFC